jgi:glycerol kinase
MLNIPMCMLPEVKESSGIFATTVPYHFFGQEVPICGVAGDQQAALFGQNCFREGMAKNTYGTGCFLLMNTGTTPRRSENGLVTTIAWGYRGKICYALEGSVFVAGSAIQWLRDQMKFFEKSSESQKMAESVITDSGVIMVPAFVGLGAPYWDDKCRGALFGITRGTTPEDITKATLESLAYQTKDVISAMEQDCDTSIETLKVDGGAAMNDYLMQFQSDILQCNVIRPVNVETTALGAAHLAGLAVGFWKDTDELETSDESSKTYEPSMEKEKSEHLYDRWKLAVSAARMFPTE